MGIHRSFGLAEGRPVSGPALGRAFHIRHGPGLFPKPSGSAAMSSPVSRPFDCAAGAHDGTGQVADHLRAAPCRGARSAGRSIAEAGHCCRPDPDMAGPQPSSRSAEQVHKPVAGVERIGARAWLARPAAPVNLPGRDTRDPYLGAFGAPDRAVSVVNRDRGAGEARAGRDDPCRGCWRGQKHVPAGKGDREPDPKACGVTRSRSRHGPGRAFGCIPDGRP